MDAGTVTLTIAMLIAIALAFDFMNGFHDAANSIATVVSTGVLKPYQAVIWAAFFNFVAIALFELKVAATVGKGIVEPDIVDNYVIFGALIGAIAWNFITWYYGIPSSSSHALIGGMLGAVIAKAGAGPLLAPGITNVNRLIGLGPKGEPFTFAVNVLNDSEFAGACFSPDGEILFVNLFGDAAPGSGMTCAIWGPWERGPL